MDNKINKSVRYLLTQTDELKASISMLSSDPVSVVPERSPCCYWTDLHATLVTDTFDCHAFCEQIWSHLAGSSGDVGRKRTHMCTMTEFLEMSRLAKIRVPLLQQDHKPLLCLRDATDIEMVHLIHAHRQECGRSLQLGPFTVQQAVCLHIATIGSYSEARMIELEEVAKREDALASEVEVKSRDRCSSSNGDASLSTVSGDSYNTHDPQRSVSHDQSESLDISLVTDTASSSSSERSSRSPPAALVR